MIQINARFVQQLFLDFLQTGRIVLQHREITVDDGVQQAVTQKAGVVGAQTGAGIFQPFINRIEHLVGLLLKGEQRTAAQKQIDLIGPERPVHPVSEAGDDEQAARRFRRGRVVLDLGAVLADQDILHRQGVQMVLAGKALQHRLAIAADDVDPAHFHPFRPMLFDEVVQIVDLPEFDPLR